MGMTLPPYLRRFTLPPIHYNEKAKNGPNLIAGQKNLKNTVCGDKADMAIDEHGLWQANIAAPVYLGSSPVCT
jgi:hypothetical protein